MTNFFQIGEEEGTLTNLFINNKNKDIKRNYPYPPRIEYNNKTYQILIKIVANKVYWFIKNIKAKRGLFQEFRITLKILQLNS